jgi:hypothetical protein
MKLTIALLSESNVKNLAKTLGQLQENLDKLKAMVELKSQETLGLQEQQEQCLNHQWQDVWPINST